MSRQGTVNLAIASLPEKIKGMIDRLIDRYDPELVVLFGSVAKGRFNEDSDVDLLVVKGTEQRPIWRRVEAMQAIEPEMPVDVLVYTPEEFEELVSDGTSLVAQIMEEGIVIYRRK